MNAAKKAASADFAKLVEMFNEHGVPFVSVTQCFNITTGMGRLTLNVLLSFAHFERNFSLWSSIGAALACARRGRPADWRPLGWRCGRGGRTDAASVFDLGAPRDIAQAARHAVNDLEDGEAWPEEGLAHRELDMVQSRLNDLMLRNAPARVARGRQRRDPRAQADDGGFRADGGHLCAWSRPGAATGGVQTPIWGSGRHLDFTIRPLFCSEPLRPLDSPGFS